MWNPKEKDVKATESAKAVSEYLNKTKRPLESPLSTRYCPDHPGTSVIRVGEDTYQCPLDKNVYNYNEGYTLMTGTKVPGGNVEEQTQAIGDRKLEQTNFSTRESTINTR